MLIEGCRLGDDRVGAGDANGTHFALDMHEHFTIDKGFGTQCTFSRNIDNLEHCDQLCERHDSHGHDNCAPLSTMRGV